MIKRLVSIIKVIGYHIRYKKSLQWDASLFCRRVGEIKITKGTVNIGKQFDMNQGSYIVVADNGTVNIGKHCYLNRNAMLICRDSITIGDYCGIGPNTMIYDHDHCFNEEGPKEGYKTAPVVIGNNCWIGGGVAILRGTTIGEGSIIGAGVVIKGNIPPYSLVTMDREIVIKPLCGK